MQKKKEILELQTTCVAMTTVAASFNVDVFCNGVNNGTINVIVNKWNGYSIDSSRLCKKYTEEEDLAAIQKEAVNICLERSKTIFQEQ